ncbi:MAG: hypothetical protein ACRBDI_05425 [Alphaproteobacteria bacterium]
MVKKQLPKKEKSKSEISDKTKGALFLAISFAALISVCFIMYMRFDKSGHFNEKVIIIKKESTEKQK